MNQNKLGKFIFYGAIVGACISLLDRNTRADLKHRTTQLSSDVKFYSKNTDILKWKLEEKIDKAKSVYGQISSDVEYLSQKMNELKSLTPQVKTLVLDTKEAFVDSKEEYKTIIHQGDTTLPPVQQIRQ